MPVVAFFSRLLYTFGGSLFSYAAETSAVDKTTTADGSTHFLNGIAVMLRPSKFSFHRSTLKVNIPISF
jgi:hypothetical protein